MLTVAEGRGEGGGKKIQKLAGVMWTVSLK